MDVGDAAFLLEVGQFKVESLAAEGGRGCCGVGQALSEELLEVARRVSRCRLEFLIIFMALLLLGVPE